MGDIRAEIIGSERRHFVAGRNWVVMLIDNWEDKAFRSNSRPIIDVSAQLCFRVSPNIVGGRAWQDTRAVEQRKHSSCRKISIVLFTVAHISRLFNLQIVKNSRRGRNCREWCIKSFIHLDSGPKTFHSTQGCIVFNRVVCKLLRKNIWQKCRPLFSW